MKPSATSRCVYCKKRKAVTWGGHVLLGKVKVVAGWCRLHELKIPGFSGHFSRWMIPRADVEQARRDERRT